MIDIYEFMERCREEGMSGEDALAELARAEQEAREHFYDEYYNSPDVCAGWAQQDLIDSYRRER